MCMFCVHSNDDLRAEAGTRASGGCGTGTRSDPGPQRAGGSRQTASF